MVFIDESSKDERTIYRHYGRSIRGERASLSAPFRQGDRFSIVAALALEGYIAQRIVEGSVDGGEFFDFITEVVCIIFFLSLCIYANDVPLSWST